MNASRQHSTELAIQTTESNTPPEYLYHDAVTRVTRPSRHHRGLHCVTLCDMWDVGVLKRVVHALQYVLHERCSIRTAQKTHATHLPHAATKTCINHTANRQQNKTPCRYISTPIPSLSLALSLLSPRSPSLSRSFILERPTDWRSLTLQMGGCPPPPPPPAPPPPPPPQLPPLPPPLSPLPPRGAPGLEGSGFAEGGPPPPPPFDGALAQPPPEEPLVPPADLALGAGSLSLSASGTAASNQPLVSSCVCVRIRYCAQVK